MQSTITLIIGLKQKGYTCSLMFAYLQFLKGFWQNKYNVESNLYGIFTWFQCFYRMHICDYVEWCSPGNGTLLAMWRQFTKQRCHTDAAEFADSTQFIKHIQLPLLWPIFCLRLLCDPFKKMLNQKSYTCIILYNTLKVTLLILLFCFLYLIYLGFYLSN